MPVLAARWRSRRQGQDRLRQHAVGPVVGARRRHPRRLPAGRQAERRQARRPAGRGAGERRPVQARRRQAAVREEHQARQGRLHDRRGVLQHHAGRAARGARQQRHLHQPERGTVVDRRQGLQPAVLRGVVAERCLPRGRRRSSPTSATLKTRVPGGAELPGRQGFAGRLQAHVQGPGGRRELHQARPARLRRRARRDPRRQAAGGVHLPARRHGHQLHQAVRRRRPRQGHHAAAARLQRRPGRHQPGRRVDGRAVQHRALVARLHQRREPEVHGRVPEGIQAHPDAVRVAGLRRGAAHQRRGARREGQARRPRRGAQGLKAAKFDSVRGPFKFNANQYPIQNYYVRTVGSDPNGGGLINKSFGEPILRDRGDAYVQDCKMKN